MLPSLEQNVFYVIYGKNVLSDEMLELSLLLGVIIVNRTYGSHYNHYIYLFLLKICGPIRSSAIALLVYYCE